ncbi:response regulator [Nitrosopumilus ureiphilus]|uniref:Response regulator n=1 Tax=Nitrosopumilus ureiphilus TaxID=1470067 RepID=A0A7D5M6I9_9ARCH|nr:response regulator [Nitrosopumilus ureiphilus]QLH07693.1 response regulator [Nitrosopumilus ureiphilus]
MITVAIVDDEIALTELFTDLFEMEKIDVVGVGYDGKQAVELCSKYNPDYLLLDLSMPEFDGFYALEKLQNTSTKIIITTGLIEENILNQLNKFPILSVQYKPVDFNEVLKVMVPI